MAESFATKQISLRSALFIDFDNIFIGLRQGGAGAEERFAQDPSRWLRWLEQELGAPYFGEEGEGVARRILLRRCYLNPQSFYRSRPFFIRAGFEVVDTPTLTAQGKTSADVHMALDMMDALNHSTRFDEFIVFSGDADFTPVLLRLRQHDRRTIVLTSGPTAAAYRSSADWLIEEDFFLERALGMEEAPRAMAVTPPATGNALRRIAERLEEVATMTGGVQPIHLPAIYKDFREFKEGENWLGFYSLRGMTDAVVAQSEALEIRGEDPWWVAPRGVAAETGTPESGPSAAALGGDERESIGRHVLELVEESDKPVSLATLAQWLTDEFGESIRQHQWRGAGSFKAFLEGLGLEAIRISTAAGGYAFDPRRHEDPVEIEDRDHFADEAPELAQLAKNVHDLTDTPYLSPREYGIVLREIVKEVNENGFNMTSTSKAVRDRCYGKGLAVSRSAVSFLLKGILYSGYRLGDDGDESLARLGEVVVANTLELCRRAQMALGDEQEDAIRAWILGELGDDPAAEGESPGDGRDEPAEASV